MLQELLGHCLELYQENRQQIARLEGHLEEYGYDAHHNLASPADPLADVPAGVAMLCKLCCRQVRAALLAGAVFSHAVHSTACRQVVAMLYAALHARTGVGSYRVLHCMQREWPQAELRKQQIGTTSSSVLLVGRSHCRWRRCCVWH